MKKYYVARLTLVLVFAALAVDAQKVTFADVYQSNGTIHVVDTVLMPNQLEQE